MSSASNSLSDLSVSELRALMPNPDHPLESRNERLAQLFRFLTDDQIADVLARADGDENLDKKVSAAFRQALEHVKALEVAAEKELPTK
jgi:hypothetical protein